MRTSSRPEISKIRALCLGLLVLGGAIAPFTLLRVPECCSQRASNERNTSGSLKTIAVAQADFRSHDRDNNGINDFWRGDIAGLYSLCPSDSAEMVKLIECSVAGADSHPVEAGSTPPRPGRVTGLTYYTGRIPKAGYWFQALRHADEKSPDPNRFAACAYPADYPKSGRWTYVVNEQNTLFRRDLGRPGSLEVYPTVEELKTQWAKID